MIATLAIASLEKTPKPWPDNIRHARNGLKRAAISCGMGYRDANQAKQLRLEEAFPPDPMA